MIRMRLSEIYEKIKDLNLDTFTLSIDYQGNSKNIKNFKALIKYL